MRYGLTISAIAISSRISNLFSIQLMSSLKATVPITSVALISRNPQEHKLFELLLQATKRSGKDLNLRVAGGWVRDKLLQKESHDIDIALSDQTGVQFANSVNDYLKSVGENIRTIAVIQANPDQSKHLETANLKVLGFEIDCVNLRAETYSDSRIPEMRIGTPFEDAMRRDFTINAMFYNLHTRSVEDFTSFGLADLSAGLIRTPLSPFITFQDDPLRVLRAVRFSSRLRFRLDSELEKAANDPQIKRSLLTKVSRERVLKECDGMLFVSTNQFSSSSSSSTTTPMTLSCRPFLAFSTLYRSVNHRPHLISSPPDGFTSPHCIRLNLLDAILPAQNYSLAVSSSVDATTSSTAQPIAMLRFDPQPDWQSLAIDTVTWLTILLNLADTVSSKEGNASGLLSRIKHHILSNRTSEDITIQSTMKSHPDVMIMESEASQPSLRRKLNGNELVMQRADLERMSPSSAINDHCPIRLMYWSAVLTSLRQFHVTEKKRSVELPMVLLRDELKMDNQAIRNIQLLLSSIDGFRSLLDSYPDIKRETAGLLLREYKELWGAGLLLSCAESLAKLNQQSSINEQKGNEEIPIRQDMVDTIVKYGNLEERLQQLGLDNIWQMKPLLNGKELGQRLSIPAGPIIGKMMDLQVVWQLREQSQDVEKCVEFLRQHL